MAFLSNYSPFGQHPDYFTDRLCRIYTVFLFLVLAAYLSYQMNQPDALSCWMPAHFTDPQTLYAAKACAQADLQIFDDTTFVPFKEDQIVENKYNLGRMKYLPVVIVAQSLLFLLPWIFWKEVSSGIVSLQAIVIASAKGCPGSSETLAKELGKMKSMARGVFLILAYLMSKAAYWIICFVQMYIMSSFLNINFFTYRYYQPIASTYINTNTCENCTLFIQAFPRKVICEYPVRVLGNMQSFTIQCTVPVNAEIERCLLVIWIWLIILLVLISLSGTFHFFRSIFWLIGVPSCKESYIRSRVIGGPLNIDDVTEFGKQHVTGGLMFVIDVVDENGSHYIASSALSDLWREFKDNKQQKLLDKLKTEEVA